jgi:tetratricopeptide (TPR) repeat protein
MDQDDPKTIVDPVDASGHLGQTIKTPSLSAGQDLSVHTLQLSSAAMPAGTELAEERYTAFDRLGGGGGGQVFAVLDRHLDREIAVKVMHASSPASSDTRRFIEEARLTARLEHPNILPIYDVGCDKLGRFYFSMRRATGQTLADMIRQASSSELPAAIRSVMDRVDLIVRVCDAVAYAHSRGIIHRDVKPSNIVLGEFGEVTLIDWGTALDQHGARSNAPPQVVGTPIYMSPEQARGEQADEKSDVYCLGATLWHLLTLHRPTFVGLPDEEFWAKKKRGELPEPPPGAPAALMDIAKKALAPKPAARYASATELRDALKTWQRHQASIALTERALGELGAVQKSKEYGSYTRVCETLRHALEDWPDNAEARAGLSRALAVTARFALARGDLELAAETLDPGDATHDALRDAIAAARRTLAKTRRKAARLRAAAAGFVLVGIAIAWWLVRDYQRARGAWQLAWQLDASADPATQLETMFATAEPPKRDDKGLLLPQVGALYWLREPGTRGNVRFEADVEWPTAVDGFEVMLHTPYEPPPQPWLIPASTSCQFGGWNGAVSFISENRTAGQPKVSDGVGVTFVPGKRYVLTFTLSRDEAALEVDHVEKLRVRSLLPLGDARYRKIALRTWGAIAIHSLKVWRQSLPAQPTPLLAGDALVSAGLYDEAARAYREVANDFRGTTIAEDALARAFLSSALSDKRDPDFEEPLRTLVAEHPNSRHRQRCEEVATTTAWAAGRMGEALESAERTLDRYPASRVALSLVGTRPARLAREPAKKLLALVARTRDVSGLDLSWMDLGDLELLRGMPLVVLSVKGTGITSLEPLRGMALRNIDFSFTDVSDLGPLRGMPLKSTSARATKVTDIRPVAAMDPVPGTDFSDTAVSDLSPLRGTKAGNVSVSRTDVRDLSPLAGLPIGNLNVEELGLTELGPIGGLPLGGLFAKNNRIRNIAALWNHQKWNDLDLSNNLIADVSGLAGSTGNNLYLSGNAIRDLSPLKAAKWDKIDVSRNPIDDLSPLAASGVTVLDASGITRARLGPFAGTKLTEVDLGGTTLVDPDAIKSLPNLKKVFGPLVGVRSADFDRIAGDLERAGDRTAVATQLRILSALAGKDVKELQKLAERTAGRRVLAIPWRATATYDQARAVAESVGAGLPMLSNPAVRTAVYAAMDEGGRAWLGLRWVNGALMWRDGTPADNASVDPEDWTRAASAIAWYAEKAEGKVRWKAAFYPQRVTATPIIVW